MMFRKIQCIVCIPFGQFGKKFFLYSEVRTIDLIYKPAYLTLTPKKRFDNINYPVAMTKNWFESIDVYLN